MSFQMCFFDPHHAVRGCVIIKRIRLVRLSLAILNMMNGCDGPAVAYRNGRQLIESCGTFSI